MTQATSRPLRERVLHTLTTVLGLLAGGAVFVVSSMWWLQGSYVAGRGGSSDLGAAWERYGDGAYAGESPVHLVAAAAGLAMLIVSGRAAYSSVRPSAPEMTLRWVGRLSGGLVGAASVSALALLVANWVGRVPLHNFRPTGADDTLYALWCLVPLLTLGIAVAGFVTARTRKPTSR